MNETKTGRVAVNGRVSLNTRLAPDALLLLRAEAKRLYGSPPGPGVQRGVNLVIESLAREHLKGAQ